MKQGKRKQAWAVFAAVSLGLSAVRSVPVAAQEVVTIPGSEAVFVNAAAEAVEVAAPSVCLMEASTGQVIYEKNADEKRSPASITKIMSLILIFDALEQGKIKMDDLVVTSAYAKSMGGSQVFLEEGETQTVETLPHSPRY